MATLGEKSIRNEGFLRYEESLPTDSSEAVLEDSIRLRNTSNLDLKGKKSLEFLPYIREFDISKYFLEALLDGEFE